MHLGWYAPALWPLRRGPRCVEEAEAVNRHETVRKEVDEVLWERQAVTILLKVQGG